MQRRALRFIHRLVYGRSWRLSNLTIRPVGPNAKSMNPAKSAATKRPTKRSKTTSRLGRGPWIAAAREELIAGGIDRVRVQPLAARLGVTTGSFYWHFADRPTLLDALLKDWEETNTAGMVAAVRHAGSPRAQFEALVEVWIAETDYSPAYDSAVRDWARNAADVAKVVQRVDDRRIALLVKIFLALGYDARAAFIRARVTYFHQVGYYALGIVEGKNVRAKLKRDYVEVLLGPKAN